jgi:hypothetical protein
MSSTQEVGEIFGEGSGPAHAMLRSPTVLIASIGLWGMNVYFFRLFGIDYVRVLKHDLMLLDATLKDEPEMSPVKSMTMAARMKKSPEVDSLVVQHGDELDGDGDDDDEWESDESYVDYSAITWERLVILSMILLVMLHATVVYVQNSAVTDEYVLPACMHAQSL